MNNFKIKWQKTGNSQWTANSQLRTSVTYSAVINLSGSTYTLTINPGAVITAHTTLKNAKNQFRKYLFTK